MALDIFRIADGQEMTDELLIQYIRKNDAKTNQRYKKLWNAYSGDFEIYHKPPKPAYKPDNRLAVNFPRHIVDSFEGFFLGIPIKISSTDEAVMEYVNAVDAANDSDDINSELSTIVSIFGRGYRIIFVDEDGDIGTAYLDPMESFAVYNESIKPRMRYFVRTYLDANKVRRGSISDDTTVRYFSMEGGELKWLEEYPHGFSSVPAIEFVQNRARTGLFEPVLPLCNSYNKILSEKANDVDAFAEAYLAILGTEVDEEGVHRIRDDRIINIYGTDDAKEILVQFLTKPTADGTQENLLQREEDLIYRTSMVANISDETFGSATSGKALKFKVWAMSNLAQTFDNKILKSLKKRYKIWT